MRLIDDLESELRTQESYFRTQLLKEDLERVRRAADLCAAATSLPAFLKDALLIGWTPGDTRTFELKGEIEAMLAAMWRVLREGGGAEAEASLDNAWRAFELARLDRLVGCLARVPRPDA